ncbi:MAG: 1-acyl-sn-glycerol-3-phosphate acyltransferase [Candidatus Binatia bacterium]
MILLRGQTPRRRNRPFLSPSDVARRLAALERQVEDALGGRAVARALPALETAVGDLLGAYVGGREWLARQAGGLASTILGDLSLAALHRWWWRIDVVGRERIPAGRVLFVANRGSSLLPYDALMASVALGAHGDRHVQPFVDEWLMELPLVGRALAGLGARSVSTSRIRRVLAADEAALAFPEGRDAVARPYREAYRVGRLSRTALLRLAIEMAAPIVPVGIIGVDEVHPVVRRVPLPKLVAFAGVPALPLTPTLVPLPTKWTLFVGEPLDVAARHGTADARRAPIVRALATEVHERLQGLVSDGLRRRRAIFF